MSTEKNDWNTVDGKRAIFQAVMRHLKANPEEASRCLDMNYARQLVQDKGNTEIPADAQVLFLQRKDLSAGVDGAGSSLVIEIPPEQFDPEDESVFQHAACTYPLWLGTGE